MNFRQINTDNSQMNCGTTKTIDKKQQGETLLKGRKGSIFILFIILFFPAAHYM